MRQEKISSFLPSSNSVVSLHYLPLVQSTQKQVGHRVWEIHCFAWERWRMDLTTNRQMTGILTNPREISSPLVSWLLFLLLSLLSLHYDLYKMILITSILQQLSVASRTTSKLPAMVLSLPIFPVTFQANPRLGHQSQTQKLPCGLSNVSNYRAFTPVLSSVWKYLLWLNSTHPLGLCWNVIFSESFAELSPFQWDIAVVVFIARNMIYTYMFTYVYLFNIGSLPT